MCDKYARGYPYFLLIVSRVETRDFSNAATAGGTTTDLVSELTAPDLCSAVCACQVEMLPSRQASLET